MTIDRTELDARLADLGSAMESIKNAKLAFDAALATAQANYEAALAAAQSADSVLEVSEPVEPEPLPEPEPVPVPETGFTATHTATGMVLEATLTPGTQDVTLRASSSPITTQTGWYTSGVANPDGTIRLELTKFTNDAKRYWQLERGIGTSTPGTDIIFAGEATPLVAPAPTPPPPAPAPGGTTGGSGGAKTDRLNQTFTGSRYTDKYHIFADGLDWTKKVGVMVYGDGSGEYGLKNPAGSYLLGYSSSGNHTASGLVATAKKNNMLLITPMSPNHACSDGDGSCWYQGDSPGYTLYLKELLQHVYSQYDLSLDRFAFGGYSSGAQLGGGWFLPMIAQDVMKSGVVVLISYGRAPAVTPVAWTDEFKNNIHINWNCGDADTGGYSTSYGARAGHTYYTGKGFKTSLDVIPGLGHSRSDFGRVMNAQVLEHVIPA